MDAATAERRRILLVDDIELNRVLTEAVLRHATYDVDSVSDGNSALAALDKKPYDLVLMDLDMPGLGGHETTIAIRETDHRSVKVVALSSRRGVDARLRSRAVGMSAHIARPIAPQDLVREVEEVFGQNGLADQRDPWERRLYEEWVERLGAERMRGFLAKLLGQFRTLLTVLVDAGVHPSDLLHRQAHDAASTAGMLGFLEVTRCCRTLLETTDLAADRRGRPALVEALERAILRLDRHLLETETRATAA